MGFKFGMRRKYAVDLIIASELGEEIQDENEKFALFKSASYLMGILSVRPIYDDETIRVLLWILKADARSFLEFLNGCIDESSDRKSKNEINELMHDPDECIEYINKSIRTMQKKNYRKMQPFIWDLLEKKKEALQCKGSSSIEKKLTAFKTMFKLTEMEIEFCSLMLVNTLWKIAESYFVDHLECHFFTNRKYLTSMMQVSITDLDNVLAGTLSKINFFEMDRHTFTVTEDFVEFFQKPYGQVLSKKFYKKMTAKSIPLSMHMIDLEQTNHVLSLLKKKPQKATHILIYGPPGTGKTSYTAGLLQELGLVGYEIAKDENNESKMRRAAIIACYNMKQNDEKAVIVIDEADNLLNTQNAWFRNGETHDKGWLNKLLEDEGIRMIWITNSIDAIADSVIRRFAYSVHFKAFNRRQRVQLWESIAGANKINKFYDQKEILQLAKNYKVSAGVIDMAVQKSVETYSIRGKEQCKKAIVQALDAHEILVHEGNKKIPKDNIEECYSLDGLNIKGELPVMIQQLEKVDVLLRQRDRKRNLNMNLLFYGPPGTGKSELARYIGHHLDRELLCKRASDIKHPFVGMTERIMSAMFTEAEDEDAVLIIDEADSLLYSRDRAEKSWEISETNEFLTQMERFNGILICTTNRLRDLDSASIRRFNHKIEFNYLTAEGNIIFYNLFLAPLSNGDIDEKSRSTLAAMSNLAPGDFKVVRDRFTHVTTESATNELMIQALRDESQIKIFQSGRKSIGFSTSVS
jgi:SpoVK/Ycf46/Vps4 family AAA+-type ATPase